MLLVGGLALVWIAYKLLAAEARQAELFEKKLAEEEVWIRKGIEARRTRNAGRVKRLEQMRVESADRRRVTGNVQMLTQDSERSGHLVVDARSLSVNLAGKPVLKDVQVMICRGDRVGILGPNGSGKSTTLKCILDLVTPTEGAAWIFEVPATKVESRLSVGFLPENPYFYDYLTAEELLQYFASLFGLSPAEGRRRASALCDEVGLGGERRFQLRKFSKGMLQRVGIAQALINNPDLLILDEPTSGLDPLGRMKVREIIQRLKSEGKTVFFSSHELGEVETVCDHVAILCQGELKTEGRVADLVKQYSANLEQIFLRLIGHPATP